MLETNGAEWPAKSSMPARLIGGIVRCRNHLVDRDERVTERHDLTWTQFVVLAVLRGESREHAMTPKAIGRYAQVTTGGLSKILTLLETRGFITRSPSDEDGRSRLVVLTDEGKAVAESVFEQVVALNEALLREALSDRECEELARLVRKLSGHLDNLADRGRL